MNLLLRAISYKGKPIAGELSISLDNTGGTIGRSQECQLVLPDPDKYISRLHARIHFESGCFYLEDCSAAGTLFESSGSLLQQSRQSLSNGERLRIGEYQLEVTISEAFSANNNSEIAPVRQLDLAARAPLDGPFGGGPRPSPAANSRISFVEQPDASVFQQSFTPPEVADQPNKSPHDADFEVGDLLSSLESLNSSSVPNNGSGARVKKKSALLSEFPELPADFFADIPPKTDNEPSQLTADDPFAPLNTSPEKNRSGEQEVPFTPASPAARASDKSPAPSPPTPSAFENEVESPMLQKTPGVSSASSDPTNALASELVHQFFAGAGFADASLLPPEQWPVLMRNAGEIVRSMVDGLMSVLRARAELKSQFRVSVTTMRPLDNNPLKFTPNVDDALKLIFGPAHPGFLAPDDAVRESFADIMHHQMAMTAGIQAALAEILRRFDPALIEKTHAEGLQFQRKAKCWDDYSAQYPKLKVEAQEELFGDAFGDAYERQMQMLSRSSKR